MKHMGLVSLIIMVYGAFLINRSTLIDYNVHSSGTQPNLAYGAGSNNDEETGKLKWL